MFYYRKCWLIGICQSEFPYGRYIPSSQPVNQIWDDWECRYLMVTNTFIPVPFSPSDLLMIPLLLYPTPIKTLRFSNLSINYNYWYCPINIFTRIPGLVTKQMQKRTFHESFNCFAYILCMLLHVAFLLQGYSLIIQNQIFELVSCCY